VDQRVPVAVNHIGVVNESALDPITKTVVLTTVGLAGLNFEFSRGVPIALIIVALTIPMWWTSIMRFEFARLLLVLGVASMFSGYYLASLASVDHAVTKLLQQQALIELFGGMAILIAVLWGRSHFPLHWVAVAYGAGDLANAFLYSSRSWKYYLALPTTIIVVGWMGRNRSRLPAAGALVVLGVITALDRGRSFFAFCTLAAAIIAWQVLIRPQQRDRAGRWGPALVIVGAATALYNLAIELMKSGTLGEAAQQRTVTQIETSGSLLVGGRPTWSATIALITDRPSGYGLGVVPNTHDYAIVRSAFNSLNLPQNDGYIRNYLLGGTFRLHSIAADLWVRYGVVGLALAATMAFALGRSAITLIARRSCPPLVALMAILGIWYLAFEPTFSYGNDVFFALGVALLPRAIRSVAAPASTLDPASHLSVA
jgi:hypothetical protein